MACVWLKWEKLLGLGGGTGRNGKDRQAANGGGSHCFPFCDSLFDGINGKSLIQAAPHLLLCVVLVLNHRINKPFARLADGTKKGFVVVLDVVPKLEFLRNAGNISGWQDFTGGKKGVVKSVCEIHGVCGGG